MNPLPGVLSYVKYSVTWAASAFGVNGPVRRLLRNAVIVDVKADTVSEDHVEHVDVAIDRSLQRFEDAAVAVGFDIDLTRVAAGRDQDAPHSSTSILRPFPARIRSC